MRINTTFTLKTFFILLFCFLSVKTVLGQIDISQCNAVLDSTVKEKYYLSEEHNVSHLIEKYFSMSNEEYLRERKKSSKKVRVIYKNLDAAFNKNKDNQRIENIRSKITKYGIENLDESSRKFVYKEAFGTDVINAWIECIKLLSPSKSGIFYETSGDTESEFFVILRWNPSSDTDIGTRLIKSIKYTSDLKPLAPFDIKDNTIIETFTGLSQKFKRINDSVNGTITINIKGVQPINIDIPKKHVPPPTPKKIISEMKIDFDITDSGWAKIWIDIIVNGIMQSKRILTKAESGNYSKTIYLQGDPEVKEINSIKLRAEEYPASPHGTVYWDCVEFNNFEIRYKLVGKQSYNHLGVNSPELLVPNPNGSKTNCPGVKESIVYRK